MAIASPDFTPQIGVRPTAITTEPSLRAYVGSPVGRNDQRPCGSEKKYKHCCSWRQHGPLRLGAVGSGLAGGW